MLLEPYIECPSEHFFKLHAHVSLHGIALKMTVSIMSQPTFARSSITLKAVSIHATAVVAAISVSAQVITRSFHTLIGIYMQKN